MTINEYQAEALRTADGMSYPTVLKQSAAFKDRRVTYDTGRTY